MRALAVLAVAAAALARMTNLNLPNTIPGGYMVELASAPRKRAADTHAQFLGELERRAAGKFTTRKKYDSPLFNGLAVQLLTEEDLVGIASIANVVAVRPIQLFKAPSPVAHHVASGPDDPALPPFGQSTHYMTGVDKVHASGISGKGIKVAIIDSGVDYLHPSLGGGFGPGYKVAGGYDLAGDAYTGENAPVPDADPRDTCDGHGTHVAGIVGADPGNEFNVSGVAYDATILAYRVFGCEGGVAEDVLTEAMLRAYEDGADVVTMSLGQPSGWTETTTAVVANRLAERGRVVTVAAGNEGPAGPMYMASPATGPDVIAVASVQNIVTMRQTLTTSASHAPMAYEISDFDSVPGQPLPFTETLPVYALSNDPDASDLACTWLGPDVDLSGHAVVIPAATQCGYDDQITWLGQANVQLVIFYNTPIFYTWSDFPVVTLFNSADGRFLVEQFGQGTNVTVSFPQHGGGADVPNASDGGLMSWFSSYGPGNEGFFKPALSAPGGNITSTYPIDGGSWAVESGTSMATPYLAGAAALVLQAKGRAAARNVRTLLQTTSKGLPSTFARDALPESLAKQGAGLVNVFNAVTAETLVQPGELLLNDTAHWRGVHKITITNTGKTMQTYKLKDEPAGTLLPIPEGSVDYAVPPNIPLVSAPVTVRFSPGTLTVAPGRSATVTITISPAEDVDPKRLPIVSGWIALGSSGVRVPYMGVAGDLGAAQTLSTGNAFAVPDDGGVPALLPNDDDYVYAQRGARNYTRDVLPQFAFALAQPSRRVVLDLIDAATDVESTIPDPFDGKVKRAWSSWWPGLRKASGGPSSSSYASVPVVGTLFEWAYVPRDGLSSSISPFVVPYSLVAFPKVFANGTDIPFGQYKLLLRALRLNGDPAKLEDYDIYASQQLGILEGCRRPPCA